MRVLSFPALLIAACSGPEPAPPSAAAAADPLVMEADDPGRNNPTQMRLAALSETERREALAAMIRDGGEQCRAAERIFYLGSASGGEAMWSVACSGSGDWFLAINMDAEGSTSIGDCTVMAQMGVQCWQKLGA